MLSPQGINLLIFTDANYNLIENLVGESKQEGHEMVQRTINDYASGANRFSHPGEGLWGLLSGSEIIGMGGLNIDPYVNAPNVKDQCAKDQYVRDQFVNDAATGRVRHLYVRQSFRRQGCATILMDTIIAQARLHFHTLRLFTANPAAATFYEKLGFKPLPGDKVTHVLTLR